MRRIHSAQGEFTSSCSGYGTPEQLLVLHEAWERLGDIEPRVLQVAEMRALMGMEMPAIAAALSLSEPTIKRDWR